MPKNQNITFIKILVLISFFSLSTDTANCSNISAKDAAQQSKAEGLQKPSPNADGRLETLNKKGAMSPELDPTSLKFVEFAATPNVKVLEVGAGYGLACIEALKKGASDYTANDLDIRHLKILATEVMVLYPQYLDYLQLMPGDFPKDVRIHENYYDAVLIARVLHFMNPQEAIMILKAIYYTLKPNGRVYAVMLSPYVKGFSSFIPEFEERIRQNKKNPGYVENLQKYADPELLKGKAFDNTNKPFFFFDTRTASAIFEAAGFTVEEATETPLAYQSKIWQLDGRENIGIIACKKPKSKL